MSSFPEQAAQLTDVWAPKTPNIPKDIRIIFTKQIDLAHYEYTVKGQGSAKDNKGIAVVDGEEVRIWQALPDGGESWGRFNAIQAANEPSQSIVLDGVIAHGPIGPTQLRLAKQRGSVDDPLASAWMKNNPTQFETMFKEWLPAINNKGSDDDAFNALGAEQQQTMMGGFSQGIMLRAGLMQLAQIGLPKVTLEITASCYTAAGIVPSKAKQKEVDKVLIALTTDAEQQFGRTYRTCNNTVLAGDVVKDSSASTQSSVKGGFDFEAALAQPKQLLAMMAPNAKLSINGDCVQLDGKLPTSGHKVMLGNMLKQLVAELSEESGQNLKACNNASP